MIKSFDDQEAERIFKLQGSRRYAQLQRVILKKLVQLHVSGALDDLRIPPGNRLEALKGDRKGQHSIRINDPYRICFEWKEGHAYKVEITDYH